MVLYLTCSTRISQSPTDLFVNTCKKKWRNAQNPQFQRWRITVLVFQLVCSAAQNGIYLLLGRKSTVISQKTIPLFKKKKNTVLCQCSFSKRLSKRTVLVTATLCHHPEIFKERGFFRTTVSGHPPRRNPQTSLHLRVILVCAQSVLLEKHMARQVISKINK